MFRLRRKAFVHLFNLMRLKLKARLIVLRIGDLFAQYFA